MNTPDNVGLLLHKIGALMERLSDSVLFEAFGLGFSQVKILNVLEQAGELQQSQIALALGQTEPSVTRQIKLLKDAHLVVVRLGDDDKKKHLVSLSKKGRDTAVQAQALLNSHYMPVLAALTEREQEALMRQLRSLHDRLDSSVI